MSDTRRLYIAGTGMITSIGFDTASTAAAVRAGSSGYSESDYHGIDNVPITMAAVPDVALDAIEAEIDEGSRFNDRHDRVLRMAVYALRQACAGQSAQPGVPLVLAMPDHSDDETGLPTLVETLAHNCAPWVQPALTRRIHSGRAAGLEALEFAFRYLSGTHDLILVGGSDSYRDDDRLFPLSEADRLLAPGHADGFAPGEGAAFLLLTSRPELALTHQGCAVAVHAPGIAEEPGHLGSEAPYRGEGLDQAFKLALADRRPGEILRIYSSMNGERHWAREYGVAYTRSKPFFADGVEVEHPADCYGDLGAATGPALVALAATHLFNSENENACLVYSSSDGAPRGAVVLEKFQASTPFGGR